MILYSAQNHALEQHGTLNLRNLNRSPTSDQAEIRIQYLWISSNNRTEWAICWQFSLYKTTLASAGMQGVPVFQVNKRRLPMLDP